ncbi:MAG TPA: patatin-like protein [Dongiaceae bacterium]|nr:patatin-like protein [Dongiaceae bacterium]
MKQIEIRLAVVLYGGVSLAVYIHGVTREILNLVRASKLLHDAEAEGFSKQGDSTAVYGEVLRALGRDIDLRVVVDLVSGASAGGINGVMLARALAHDLPLEPHQYLWLRNADVTRLAPPTSQFNRMAKAVVAPVLYRMLLGRFGQQIRDPETRQKLGYFMQTQWFTPPFSGERFTRWMLDACDKMERRGKRRGSLLPPGHRLDLFVTLTDYRGHSHLIALHDPPSVEETEHRRIISFTCKRALSGEITSEFDSDHVPSLVFAARATASFPGAFPPATIAEMDRVLARRGRAWPSRETFLTEKLFAGGGEVNNTSYFIDGSVVMNKPFSPVIHALGNRPASREVVRRIIYVDPNPRRDGHQHSEAGAPGFFRTILASMAVIPRNEPIADDLMAIQGWNERSRRMAEILAAADPQVEKLVDEIVQDDPDNPPTIEQVARYRAMANDKAHAGAGYAYLSYQTLKRRRLIDRLARLIAALAKSDPAGNRSDRIEELLDRSVALNGSTGATAIVPFLRGFDIDFRLRRVRFVIRRLNELYRDVGSDRAQVVSSAIDDLKTTLYDVIERLSRLWQPKTYGPDVVAVAVNIAELADAGGAIDPSLLAPFEQVMALTEVDHDIDEIISLMGLAYLPALARRAVAMSYVGFSFYDLITFPILQWTDMDEINEVLVDRISPADAHGIGEAHVVLKGTALMNFGAFFNRAWREHDYLWGRLNAADRCLDMLLSAVGPRLAQPLDTTAIRQRLFNAILDAEAPNLRADPDLIDNLRRKLNEAG